MKQVYKYYIFGSEIMESRDSNKNSFIVYMSGAPMPPITTTKSKAPKANIKNISPLFFSFLLRKWSIIVYKYKCLEKSSSHFLCSPLTSRLRWHENRWSDLSHVGHYPTFCRWKEKKRKAKEMATLLKQTHIQ